MSKMNHEHRNRMDKVRKAPPAPPRRPRRNKKGKGNAQAGKELQRHLGHVRLASKYKSKCAVCPTSINVGNLIWWNPDEKYVVHDQCFRKYFS
jgi:hypothetical protein